MSQPSRQLLRYRAKREAELGIPWDQMEHKRGRKACNDSEKSTRSRVKYRAMKELFLEHVRVCTRVDCTICVELNNAKKSPAGE